jgi:hypothetical protein
MAKLAVIVMGNRKAGKSRTWNVLFGRTVRTGSETRRLPLSDGRSVDVFLVSASPEERRLYLGDIVDDDARIVLCSLQYTSKAQDSFSFFLDHGYTLYIQWLNPGFNDPARLADTLGFSDRLLHLGATLRVRDGRTNPRSRVRELRDFITGWTAGHRSNSPP